MKDTQREYGEYLQSPYWQEVKAKVKARDQFQCQLCCSSKDLEVHHKHYRHRGNELEHLDCVITLCHDCHDWHHKKSVFSAKPVEPYVAPTVTSSNATTFITRKNVDRVSKRKPAWHWLKDNGFAPDKKNWKKRLINHFIPSIFLK